MSDTFGTYRESCLDCSADMLAERLAAVRAAIVAGEGYHYILELIDGKV